MSGDDELAAGREAARMVLPSEQDAPRAAREFAMRTLRQWGVGRSIGPVELVVSELVTNVVIHSGTVTTLRLIPMDGGLVVEVDDASGGEPRIPATSGAGGVGGLGLKIVDRLAQEWGFRPRADGKTVWARLRLAGEPGPEGGNSADADEVVSSPPRERGAHRYG